MLRLFNNISNPNSVPSYVTYASLGDMLNDQTNPLSIPAYTTYAALTDMLNDENRTGLFQPSGFGAKNIIGSGAY